MKYDADSVESYLEAIPSDHRKQLEKIMDAIKEAAPGVEQEFRNNLPFYCYKGKPVFAVASQKHYMSIYIADPELVYRYNFALGKATYGKNSIKFTDIKNLNLETVKDLLGKVYERKREALDK